MKFAVEHVVSSARKPDRLREGDEGVASLGGGVRVSATGVNTTTGHDGGSSRAKIDDKQIEYAVY